MKVDRGPILAAVVTAVVVSLAACVSPFEPEGEPEEVLEEDQTDFRVVQVYSGRILVLLPS